MGDAVGRLINDADMFTSEAADATIVFNDTSTEHVILDPLLKNEVPYFPYVEECSDAQGTTSYCSQLAAQWFENRDLKNHRYVIAASKNRNRGYIGLADLFGYAVTFIYNKRIEEQIATNNQEIGGLPMREVVMEVTAHEMVHLFHCRSISSSRTRRTGRSHK